MTSETRQLALPGLVPEPVSKPATALKPPKGPRKFGGLPDRLFFALRLDAAAAYAARQYALRLQTRHNLKNWPRPKTLLHVSLCILGDYNGLPPVLVEKASEAAASIALPPFDVAFDRVTSLRSCLVLAGEDGVAGIRRLEHALGEALEKGKVREPSRHFNPHVTLIYDQTPIPTERLREPVRWRVEEFVLVHSLVAQSKHDVLRTFPLSGGPREFT
jgi:2'-5' RNA ligase